MTIHALQSPPHEAWPALVALVGLVVCGCGGGAGSGSAESQGPPRAFALATDSEGTARLHRSEDAGRTFDAGIEVARSGRARSLSFVDDAVGFLGTTGSLLRTTDGGETWQPVPLPDAEGYVLFDATFVTAQWGVVTGGVPGYRGFLSSRCDETRDGGSSWQQCGTDSVPAVRSNSCWRSDGVGFSAVGAIVYRTEGDGSPWVEVGERPEANGTLFVRCFDDGEIWAAGRLDFPISLPLIDVVVPVPSIGRSLDGGQSWTSITGNMRNDEMFLMGLSAFAVARPDRAWVGGARYDPASVDGRPDAFLAHTRDGGTTWALQTLPVGKGFVHALDFIDGSRGVARGVSDDDTATPFLSWTRDGGETWHESHIEPVPTSLSFAFARRRAAAD